MPTYTYQGSEPIRLNKWLGQSGVCSRREADAFIASGQVLVDGLIISDAGHKISSGQSVQLNEGALKTLKAQITLIYNKPVTIVSGQPEPGEIAAISQLSAAQCADARKFDARPFALAPVGRLDKDSHGLLVLSDDGVISKAIIGPESTIDKEYHVKVAGDIFEAKLRWLRHGLHLDGRALKPAIVEITSHQTLRFVLTEGRNRQIRRMCDMCELKVLDLKRVRTGPIGLGELRSGQWRVLRQDERTALLDYVYRP